MSRFRFVVACCALLAFVSMGAVAGTPLFFEWDKKAGTTVGIVKNSVGDALASIPWDGAVPMKYDAEGEEGEVPTLQMAILRDQLERSTDPEAIQALTFVRELMEPYEDLEISMIAPTLTTWIPFGDYETTESCGLEVDAAGECTDLVEGGGTMCGGFECKKTSFEQLDP